MLATNGFSALPSFSFNHKTAGEHVHFTSFDESGEESEDEVCQGEPVHPTAEDVYQDEAPHKKAKRRCDVDFESHGGSVVEDVSEPSEVEESNDSLYMVLVKDVNKDAEVSISSTHVATEKRMLRKVFHSWDRM